ncbi:MAG: hypothetical protein ABWX56_09610 [Mycetocola sp.]
MQISGEYGTELLIRYTDERLTRDLERRRIMDERLIERRAAKRSDRVSLAARLAALFGATDAERMPVLPRAGGAPHAHAAHR